MTLSRRELAALVTTGAVAHAVSQAPGNISDSPSKLTQAASEEDRKNAEAIRKIKLPTVIEPAFMFRAQ